MENMNNLTYVYLIRHSEQLRIENNADENSQIANEKIVLSVEGEKKAEEISKLDELKNLNDIWSSSYARAIGTAKYIAKENNIGIKLNNGLNERKLRRFRQTERIRKRKK